MQIWMLTILAHHNSLEESYHTPCVSKETAIQEMIRAAQKSYITNAEGPYDIDDQDVHLPYDEATARQYLHYVGSQVTIEAFGLAPTVAVMTKKEVYEAAKKANQSWKTTHNYRKFRARIVDGGPPPPLNESEEL